MVSCMLRRLALILCASLPFNRPFRFKSLLLTVAGFKVGRKVSICSSPSFLTCGSVGIGDDVWIGHGFMLVGGASSVLIGDKTDIGPRVTIATGTHVVMAKGAKAAGPGYSIDVVIDSGCWICANATILGGSHIGSCSIVAAGAVVRGVFPPRCLIGGVPARIIRYLSDDEI